MRLLQAFTSRVETANPSISPISRNVCRNQVVEMAHDSYSVVDLFNDTPCLAVLRFCPVICSAFPLYHPRLTSGFSVHVQLGPPVRRPQQAPPRHPPSPPPQAASVTTTVPGAPPTPVRRGPTTTSPPPQVGLPQPGQVTPEPGQVTLWSGAQPRARLREPVRAITTNRRAAPSATKGPPTITTRGAGPRAGGAGLHTRTSTSRRWLIQPSRQRT